MSFFKNLLDQEDEEVKHIILRYKVEKCLKKECNSENCFQYHSEEEKRRPLFNDSFESFNYSEKFCDN